MGRYLHTKVAQLLRPDRNLRMRHDLAGREPLHLKALKRGRTGQGDIRWPLVAAVPL